MRDTNLQNMDEKEIKSRINPQLRDVIFKLNGREVKDLSKLVVLTVLKDPFSDDKYRFCGQGEMRTYFGKEYKIEHIMFEGNARIDNGYDIMVTDRVINIQKR